MPFEIVEEEHTTVEPKYMIDLKTNFFNAKQNLNLKIGNDMLT